MEKLDKNTSAKKSLLRFLIISCAILFSLYCFVLAPIYTYLSSNIIYMLTVIPTLLSFVIDVVDILAYAVCFASVIYSIYLFSLKGSRSAIVTVAIAIFLKYTANFFMTLFFDGALDLNDITSVLIYYILDMVWLSVIVISTDKIFRRYYEIRASVGKAAANLSLKLGDEYEIFPFKKLLDKNNPLQRSALVMGILMGSVHMLTRIIYDIFYGLPTTLADALWMITYYLSDIVTAFIMYVVALFIFMKYNEKHNPEKL